MGLFEVVKTLWKGKREMPKGFVPLEETAQELLPHLDLEAYRDMPLVQGAMGMYGKPPLKDALFYPSFYGCPEERVQEYIRRFVQRAVCVVVVPSRDKVQGHVDIYTAPGHE